MFGNLTPIVRNLLIINVVLLVVESFFGVPIREYLSLYHFKSSNFFPAQFLTYMFLHAGWGHLFFNMFALFIFGPWLERVWGSNRFLFYYLATGIGAGVLYSGINYFEGQQMESHAEQFVGNPTAENYLDFYEEYFPLAANSEEVLSQYNALDKNPDNPVVRRSAIADVRGSTSWIIENSKMLGASGAVFGILLAFGMYFPNTELFLLFPPIPIKAKYLVAAYAIFAIFGAIQKAPGDNVAHYAHLAGMLIGFIIIKIWQKHRDRFY